MKKLEPDPKILSKPILPPCRSINSLHKTRPKPTPFSLSVPNSGSVLIEKILSCLSCEIPFPLSLTVISQDKQESILDRKSTRLNSSHVKISYAVFCLKKKKTR